MILTPQCNNVLGYNSDRTKRPCRSHIGDMPNHMMIWVKHFNRVDHSIIYPQNSCHDNTISNFRHSMPMSSHGKCNILGCCPEPILSMSTLNVKTSTESTYLLSLFIVHHNTSISISPSTQEWFVLFSCHTPLWS